MSFDPYQKLAQIVENVNTRSAEGKEGAAQTNAPSFDLQKRNEYLQHQILELEAQLRRTEQFCQRISSDYAMLMRLYDLEREANMQLMSDGLEQDEYIVEIKPTHH